MFEESLVASQITHVSAAKRWTVAGSTILQVAIAATLIVIPLTHPDRLTFHTNTPLVFTPPPPRAQLPAQPQHVSTNNAFIPALQMSRPLPGSIIRDSTPVTDGPPIIGTISMGTNDSSGLPNLVAGSSKGPAVSVTPANPPTKRIVVSRGISEGILLAPIRPIYPPIAKAAGVSGTVTVEAIISKTGTIESLRAVSGPDMLRGAALDAIRTARYRPYLLNGEPVEIQTTFTVNFKIGS